MTDPDYSHHIIIADRSGSIADVPGFRTEMENGINSYIRDRAADPGRHTITLHDFDTQQRTLCSFAPLGEVLPYALEPRGGTALLDAVGQVVLAEGQKLAAMPEGERPRRISVLIVTDGLENSSREFTKARVKGILTEQQEKYGWNVSYLGTNQDAMEVAESLGVPDKATMDFAPTAQGSKAAWAGASSMVSRYTRGGEFSYTDEEISQAMEED